MHLTKLWQNIESRLDSEHSGWRERINDFGQVQAVEDRRSGRKKTWTDDEVFEALLMSVLSANTKWERIESVQPDLKTLFSGFELEAYAKRRKSYIVEVLVPWFEERGAGSPNLKKNLILLISAVRILSEHSRKHGSAESYFTNLMKQHGNDPKQVALCVGKRGSKHKLPALGIPLAAEALKNLGFDVAKPDRHVRRAVAAFGLADFQAADARYKPPPETVGNQWQTMKLVEDIAHASGELVAFLDNAIWMLGAEEPLGLHLENRQLAELAGNERTQQKDQSGLLALLDSWMKEGDSEEQRETLEYLIRAMDENRPEGYKLFPPELKGKSW